MTLTCDPSVGSPDTVLHLRGTLTFATAPTVRTSVLKALAERPDAVLVDVSDMTADDDVALAAFPALQRQAAADDVPLMLVGPSPILQAQLSSMAVTRTVPVFATHEVALATRPAPSRVTRLLLPGPEAGVAARDVVDQACGRWRLDDLEEVAALVVTELVANAVRHAHTEFIVTITLRSRYLHLAVRDFDLRPPVRAMPSDSGGRGLLIVEGVTAAWGFAPTIDGKVVWATLKLPPRR